LRKPHRAEEIQSSTLNCHEKLQMVMNLRKGGLYNPGFLEKDRDSLREIYGALGYLEAEVGEFETKIDEKENTVAITISIHEGMRTVINSIDIAGVDTDTKNNLLKIINIKTGDPYNEVDISDNRFRILDYYSSLGFDNVDVTIKSAIEEHKASVIFSVSEGEKRFSERIIT
jgi:outer membrane protein assembly factor BamA